MPDESQPPQISFRVPHTTHEALKAKTKSESQTVTGLMKSLIEQYLEGKASDDPHPTAPPATTALPIHPTSQWDASRNERRLDSVERLMMSMLDMTAVTNRIASLEIRFVNFINLLEKRFPAVAGYDLALSTSMSQSATGSQMVESVPPLLERLAKVEDQLANCIESQQLQDHRIHQAIAEFKANIEKLLATQLADHNARLQEMQQSMSVRYDENLESLTEIKANLVGQIEQHLVQIPALTEAMANLQQQVQATKPPASLPMTPESSTPSKDAVSVSNAHQVKAAQQQAKPLVSQPENTSTASSDAAKQLNSDAAKQLNSKKKAVSQIVEQSTSSSLTVDGDSVVIDGARKKLLQSNEAFAIAQQHGYTGDNKQFIDLAKRKNLEQVLRPFGVGVMPELRGKRGERRAWFYAL